MDQRHADGQALLLPTGKSFRKVPGLRLQVDNLQDLLDRRQFDEEGSVNIRQQIEEDARKRADESIERAKREIDQVSAKAWDNLVRDAAAMATEAAGRIIDRQLTPEGHAEIVAGVVSEFSAKRGGQA